MEMTLDKNAGNYVIQKYEPGVVTINGQTYRHSLILSNTELIPNWPPHSLADITPEHLEPILEKSPQILLMGTGDDIQFPNQALFAPFYNRQIGVEFMDNAAACRTYTVLTAEDRRVIMAILIH